MFSVYSPDNGGVVCGGRGAYVTTFLDSLVNWDFVSANFAKKAVLAVAAFDTSGVLKPFRIERRSVLATDVDIDIKYCGICHSDLHLIRSEWPISTAYPMVRVASFSLLYLLGM